MPALRDFCLVVTLMCCLVACGKKEAPKDAPQSPAKAVSIAEEAAPAPPPPQAPAAPEPTAQAPPDETTKVDTRVPPELRKIMLDAQKHALSTGRFPTSWDDMIKAGIVKQVPTGKDGRPMTWRDFERAIDPE